MAAATPQISSPDTMWVPLTVTKEKLLALEKHGLIGFEAAYGWKAPAGEAFPSEDDKELVVFTSYFERGFSLPVGDFFRKLLHYYRLELVHLVPIPLL
jgi:hypothetical protein